ncbi:MAG: pyrroline-5-carboxylate reductase [Actinobacteria bacterium]|nr:pyrroline-5-carboxylate reductase [Actinomycetota bacterium]
MFNKIALIGCGQMGGALIKGMVHSKAAAPGQIVVSDLDKEKIEKLKDELKINIAENNCEAVSRAEVIFLAVKPQQIESVLNEIKTNIDENKIIISIAAGISSNAVEEMLDNKIPVVRVMPNSPALVGKGVYVISLGKFAGEKEKELAEKIFSSTGKVIFINESLQNEAMALSGCGPAYFYLFVEHLINAGTANGLPEDVASSLAIETLVGAGKMLTETGKSPADLRKMVTSPGGTTLAALEIFEKKEFSLTVREAVDAAIKRAIEIGK